jgi:hypothetical protein
MSRFTWDQVDVLSCLEVEPIIDEDAVSSYYDLRRDGWRIQLTVFAGQHDVHLVMDRGGSPPFIDLWMRAVEQIRYNRQDKIEELIFLSDQDKDWRPNLPFGFALRVAPQVFIRFGDSLKPFAV